MELRALAEQVVFSTRLADKLAGTTALTDDRPGPPVGVPVLPGRPAAWTPGSAPRRPFPSLDALADPAVRGQVMHVFANHELLAMELFAMALLRWPQADPVFRRGLAAVLQDEQAHMGRYLERMAALGVVEGTVPVSRYFWDALAHVPDPLHLVSGLGLVFEQANLDHARAFEAAFRAVGDDESADIMEVVLRDELRHVRHALRWFRAWKDPTLGDWDAWTRVLAAWPGAPMSPVRARGKVFDAGLRHAAGFDATWVQRLGIAGQSKGRPPTVWLFHPGVEDAVAHGHAAWTPSAPVAQLARGLATLPLFLARREDVVVVPEAPPAEWLADLARCGFELPEVAVANPWPAGAAAAVSAPRIGGLAPWGWSPAAAAWLGELGPTGSAHPLGRKDNAARWLAGLLPSWRASLDAADWLCDDQAVGQICVNAPSAVEAVARLQAAGHHWVGIKAPLGAAGRGAIRVHGAWTVAQRRWLDRVLQQQGAVVVEPWLDRVLDVSLHWDQGADGLHARGTSTFLTSGTGAFRGAVVGRPDAGWSPACRRFLMQDGRLQRVRAALGAALATQDLDGPVGIDMFVYRTAHGLRLKPVVEVNARWTMGRVALALGKRLAPGAVGVWTVGASPAVHPAGAVRCDASGRIAEGVLHTVPPGSHWAPLVVADGLEAAQTALADLRSRVS